MAQHRKRPKPKPKKPPKPKPPKPQPPPTPPPTALLPPPGNEGAPVQITPTGANAPSTSNAAAQGTAAPAEDAFFSSGGGPVFSYQSSETFPYYLAGTITPDTTQAGSASPAGGSASP